MALSRYYKVGVFDVSNIPTGGTVTTSTPTPILVGTTTATADCNISAIRVGCLGANTFPANATFVASLNVVTGTRSGGGTAVAHQLGGASVTGNTLFYSAGGQTVSSGPPTGLTVSTTLWSQELPFTAGANWGEWFSPGFEINVPVSTQFAIVITESSPGTATSFGGELEFTE